MARAKQSKTGKTSGSKKTPLVKSSKKANEVRAAFVAYENLDA